MKEKDFLNMYADATLALFSSLNIQVAIKALAEVLGSRFPIESIFLHMADRGTNHFRIIADARVEKDEKLISVEVPQQFLKDINWYNQDQKTGFRLVRRTDSEYYAFLLTEYGLLSDSIYTAFLVIDNNHFGSVSIPLNPGCALGVEDLRVLNMLLNPLAIALANALRHEEIVNLRTELARDNDRLRNELIELKGVDVIYETIGLSEVVKNVKLVAHHDTPILILGETGVGKEVIANSIHNNSLRMDKPFITVNCGALPENLADSYLFGHEKGAFTGANQLRKGFFERADKGTLFLDEIGELSPEVQVKLLRILETSSFERVGGQSSISVDVRIVAATHRDLVQMVYDGTFREDLWYRLNIYPIIVPPLRHRIEDIPELVKFFLSKKSKELRLSYLPKIHKKDLLTLQDYSFPGNVRELQNIIERALIHYDEVTDEYISFTIGEARTKNSSRTKSTITNFSSLDNAVRSHIKESLKLSKGRIQGPGGAAELLDLHPSTLRSTMKRLNIRSKI